MGFKIKVLKVIFVFGFLLSWPLRASDKIPDTGISGVYEVMMATSDPESAIRYFANFGFKVVNQSKLSAKKAKAVYGIDSALVSYRLQNGKIDTHGLLRILHWDRVLGEGVGYAQPETIGQRMAVMRTKDIIRLDDIYKDARSNGEKWLPITPIFADLYGHTEGKTGVMNRRVGVRESAVYGEHFNHVFFQRYGYQIPGYGSISEQTPLQTSEFTHHDFIIKGDIHKVTAYYTKVLGFRQEKPPALDGDWQEGPRAVFDMAPGASHWYVGFVSPNNICGKLKFFVPVDQRPDRSANQRIGELGITLHSLYTDRLNQIHRSAVKEGLNPSAIIENEFKEKSFVFTGPDGASWQIIQNKPKQNQPAETLEFIRTSN